MLQAYTQIWNNFMNCIIIQLIPHMKEVANEGFLQRRAHIVCTYYGFLCLHVWVLQEFDHSSFLHFQVKKNG
jgi:hypothetical protein